MFNLLTKFMETVSPKKFLIFVEHRCRFPKENSSHKADDWRVYESGQQPHIGEKLGDYCPGEIVSARLDHHGLFETEYPLGCPIRSDLCEEKGRVTKIEEYSQKRAKELGLTQM
jgi:hypothetical protein